MKDLERIYAIDRLLRRRVPPTLRELQERLELSRATVNRTLAFMRDRLGAPIAYEPELRGYRYSDAAFELPGLWLTPAEIESLLLMQSLIEQMQPGAVRDKLRPFEARLRSLIPAGDAVARRVRILASPFRRVEAAHFDRVYAAAMERRRLRIRYYTRSRDADTVRTVSPQRLLYYRGNWYLDAWCHRVDAMRRFAVDAIASAEALDEAALEAPLEDDAAGYGIFSGAVEKTAVLRFDPEAARWVRNEIWHPRQRSAELPDGALRLEIPYGNSRELLMDVLRYGPEVEVLQPPELRKAVADAHRRAAGRY